VPVLLIAAFILVTIRPVAEDAPESSVA